MGVSCDSINFPLALTTFGLNLRQREDTYPALKTRDIELGMLETQVYELRRRAYMDAMGQGAVAVIHSPPETIRNGDVHFPFRQCSDLIYLCGFAEPESTLILRPGADGAETILFVRPKDPERETWEGRRFGLEGAKTNFGVDQTFSNASLKEKLPSLLANRNELYYELGIDPTFDNEIIRSLAGLKRNERRGQRPPHHITSPCKTLHELRLRKTNREIQILQKAADITCDAHKAAMKAAKPGVYEYELESLIDFHFRSKGGTGPGYNTIVGGGENATILHYTENNQQLNDSDLILIDAGCEFDFYTADVTRTFPVSGTFNDAQRACYEVVLKAQKGAISMVQPGTTLGDIHDYCVRTLTEGMIQLGLLEGSVENSIENGDYKKYYMHRTSTLSFPIIRQ